MVQFQVLIGFKMNFKKLFFLNCIIATSLVFTSFYLTSGQWILKKYDKGVAVYNRDLDTSSIKELKAVTQIKTSLSSIIALLNDRETYPQWVYKCGKSYLIKKITDSEGMYYQNAVAPWPIDNRDFAVDVKVVQDPKTKVVIQTGTAMPKFIPKVEGHVRVTVFKAVWTLTPIKNGFVNCEYELLVNPGGNIPAWIVNLAAIDGPWETTVNLREWVMKDKYQKATFPFITEP